MTRYTRAKLPDCFFFFSIWYNLALWPRGTAPCCGNI